METLTHVDEQGRARMVDVGDKPNTKRRALAQAMVTMQPKTLSMICSGTMPKGDVLACARIAGIMGAKQTHALIPMCHPLPIDQVRVDIQPQGREQLCIQAEVRCTYHTGVEMEALTACSIAALTVYDMCGGPGHGDRAHPAAGKKRRQKRRFHPPKGRRISLC